MEEVFERLSNLLQLITPTSHLIADSTPLGDLYDLEAEWGFTRKGPFKGFKPHTMVNKMGLLLKAVSQYWA